MAIRFGVRGDSIQLDQLLKAAGLADSGGAAKIEVAEGRVKVDGQVELRKRATLRPGQVVEFNGETIELTRGTAADAAPARTARPKKAPAAPPKAAGAQGKTRDPRALGKPGKVPLHTSSAVGHGRAADTLNARAGAGAPQPPAKRPARTGSRSGGQKRLGGRSTPKSKPSKA